MASLHVEPAASWLSWAYPTGAAAGLAAGDVISTFAQTSPDASWTAILSQVWSQFGLPGVVIVFGGWGSWKFFCWVEPFVSRFFNAQISFIDAIAEQGEQNMVSNRLNAEAIKAVAETQVSVLAIVKQTAIDAAEIKKSIPPRGA